MEEDDLKNFDPQRYWAKTNNEVLASRPTPHEKELIHLLIQTCRHFRTKQEILKELKISHAKFLRCLDLSKYTRGVTVERTEKMGQFLYRLRKT